jgi:uncharacterized protein (DUF362 family)
MDRRRFLQITAAAGVGLALPNHLSPFLKEAWASETPDLAVASGPSPARITEEAIKSVGGMGRFVSQGDVVVVKPNMAWDRLPEQAANTNPEVVSTVVRLCIEAGARTVKVFDRTVNDPRRCYIQSGIADAARKQGATVRHVDERKFREMGIRGMALSNWPVYSEIMEADKVINIPIAKHHGLASLTMAMKNWMGVIGGARSRIHQRLDEALVDLSGFIKPTLTVLDAVRVLTANGPQGGSLEDVKRLNTVVAGVDQVAVDSFGATLFGMKGENLGYVKLGAKAGLGVMDLSKLNIKRLSVR